jgi:hypothetical protein
MAPRNKPVIFTSVTFLPENKENLPASIRVNTNISNKVTLGTRQYPATLMKKTYSEHVEQENQEREQRFQAILDTAKFEIVKKVKQELKDEYDERITDLESTVSTHETTIVALKKKVNERENQMNWMREAFYLSDGDCHDAKRQKTGVLERNEGLEVDFEAILEESEEIRDECHALWKENEALKRKYVCEGCNVHTKDKFCWPCGHGACDTCINIEACIICKETVTDVKDLL